MPTETVKEPVFSGHSDTPTRVATLAPKATSVRDCRPDRVHPEYPRPQLVRDEWLNLNGVWQLAFAEKAEPPPLGQTLPEKILVPCPVESALSGVMRHGDRLWNRRTFQVPPAWTGAGRRLLLHFGAVDWEASVYLNGVLAAKLSGYIGEYEEIPISEQARAALRPGGKNLIAVHCH